MFGWNDSLIHFFTKLYGGLMSSWFACRNLLLRCSVFAFFLNSWALAVPSTYTVELVANAATGVDMNDIGDVIGTHQADLGCGSTCLPPVETVVWKGGVRIVLPTVPGLTGITVTGINNQGWISGFAGYLYTTTHAVVWKPVDNSYVAIDLGNLPGKTISTAIGIDDFGRVVGWSTTQNFPPSGAPFMWTEAGGMVDLSAQGFPNEMPLGISPGGMVATYGFWYDLDDPGSINTVPAPPSSYGVENSKVAINDAGDQARFLVNTGPQNLVYPFRLNRDGTWQQISFSGTGHLTTYGMGSMNEAGDVTVTVQSTGMIAYGPDGLAQSIAPLISSAYGGSAVTSIGPLNGSGEILAKMIIGQSGQRLVRLVPGESCTTNCIRVTSILMRGKGPAYCDQGNAQVKARVTVTSETGARLSGATVTGRFFDDYYLDEPVVGTTNSQGQVTFTHVGPPCIGAIALLITDATTMPTRTLDRTTGILTSYIIPLPPEGPLDFDGISAGEEGHPALVSDLQANFGLSQNYPNPFNPTTTIQFSLPSIGSEDAKGRAGVGSKVILKIYDVLAREVATLVNEEFAPGTYTREWDASEFPSGIYFYRLHTGDVVETKKLMLLR